MTIEEFEYALPFSEWSAWDTGEAMDYPELVTVEDRAEFEEEWEMYCKMLENNS